METYVCLECKKEESYDSPITIYCDDCKELMHNKKHLDIGLKNKNFNPTQEELDEIVWTVMKKMEKSFGKRPWMQYIINPFKLRKAKKLDLNKFEF